jgi:hypothetical protein
MIKFKDQLGILRAIEFSYSYCGKFVNITTWSERTTNGSTIQMPVSAFKELRLEICDMREQK